MKNKYFKIFGIVLVLFFSARMYYFLTDDFRLSSITPPSVLPSFLKSVSLSPKDKEELSLLFSQPFYYLGKGAQSYAFVSEDQTTVIKFFKFKHLKPSFFVESLPSFSIFKSYKEQVKNRKMKKFSRVFSGYQLAYEEHKEESALLYLHLLPTQKELPTVRLVNKIGMELLLPLDNLVFLIQKKGDSFEERLKHALDNNQWEQAKKNIQKITAMYLDEYSKGMYDYDRGVLYNTGFVNDTPFHLDVGQLAKDDRYRDRSVYRHHLLEMFGEIHNWMKKKFPDREEQSAEFLSEEYFQLIGERVDLRSIDPSFLKKQREAFLVPGH